MADTNGVVVALHLSCSSCRNGFALASMVGSGSVTCPICPFCGVGPLSFVCVRLVDTGPLPIPKITIAENAPPPPGMADFFKNLGKEPQ